MVLKNMVLRAPNINGTDCNRLNNAVIQILDEATGEWVSKGMVLGMNDDDQKIFELSGVEAKSLRLSHEKIEGGYCLGVGMVRFNVSSVVEQGKIKDL